MKYKIYKLERFEGSKWSTYPTYTTKELMREDFETMKEVYEYLEMWKDDDEYEFLVEGVEEEK